MRRQNKEPLRRQNKFLAKQNPGVKPPPRLTHELMTGSGGFHGVFRVALAGAGGSGSQMVSRLVQLDIALRARNRGRLHVTVFDPDLVTTANVGRQLFYPTEVGLHKSIALVDRVNKGFGLDWDASPSAYTGQLASGELGSGTFSSYDILITCVDSTKARRVIYEACQSERMGMAPRYWLDLGNDQTSGQVVLGQFERGLWGGQDKNGLRLPTVVDLFPALYAEDFADDDLPSCSLAQALDKQDLFVNTFMAAHAGQLLWRLLERGRINFHGYWINLEDGTTLPMPIRALTPAQEAARIKVTRESIRESVTGR